MSFKRNKTKKREKSLDKKKRPFRLDICREGMKVFSDANDAVISILQRQHNSELLISEYLSMSPQEKLEFWKFMSGKFEKNS